MRKRALAGVAGGVAALTIFATASAAPSGSLRPVDEKLSASISNATDVTVAPDGRQVYGVGFASDDIGVFNRNASTGAVAFTDATTGDGLLNPESIVISPDGDNAYVAGFGSDSVHAYERNSAGHLNNIDSVVDGQSGADGLAGAYDVAISPDGDHVYATGFDNDAVALMSTDADGELQWLDAFIDGLGDVEDMQEPEGIAISRDGRNVYVASGGNGAVVTFRRFPATGQLDFVESDAGFFSEANEVTVSPDGRRVYVAFNNGLRTFRRTPSTGALTDLGLTGDPPLSVNGVAVSPDGGNIYSADGLNDAATTLAPTRNGRARFVEQDGVTDFNGARAVAVSPDARHVYVAGGSAGDGHIATFSRQPELQLKGKKTQSASKLAVKAECSADCKVTLKGKGLRKATEKLRAGKPEKVKLKVSGDPSSKVTVKGKARAGNRSDADRLRIKLK